MSLLGPAAPAVAVEGAYGPLESPFCAAPPNSCEGVDEAWCPIRPFIDALVAPPALPPLQGELTICSDEAGPTCSDPLDGWASIGPPTITRRALAARGRRPRNRGAVIPPPLPDVGRVIRVRSWSSVDEHQRLELAVESDLRVFAVGLPPGAEFRNGRLSWTPDFLQGGRTWVVRFLATDNATVTRTDATIEVRDTIRPPTPVIVATEDFGTDVILTVRQTTDDFLDAPGFAGRSFMAKVVVPTDEHADRLPVQLSLHGYNGRPIPHADGSQIRIYPHDPANTYWWGYASSLPKVAAAESVPNYTQRRALHLVDWVLRTQPQADPEQVYVAGESMGGAGALALGLLYGRHFAGIEAAIGQVVARNHRPRRIAQLARLWGTPDRNLPDGDPVSPMGIWDRLDLVRAMVERPEAREQFVFTHHGKDDPVIHFGAVVNPSPAVGLSFYEALQQLQMGHYVVWDEAGHGVPDPVLDDGWWDSGWHRITDPETYVRRNLAFPAFTGSSADDDPGNGDGNGTRQWDVDRGYAGNYSIPGDTGWVGDRAGARNRYLRWDSRTIVDRWDRFEISLRVVTNRGRPPPRPGYPSRGDRFDARLPIVVDVTPRRVQAFRARPGEPIAWTFGGQQGEVVADAEGAVTVPRLALVPMYERLVLRRLTNEPDRFGWALEPENE